MVKKNNVEGENGEENDEKSEKKWNNENIKAIK